MGGAVYLIRVN